MPTASLPSLQFLCCPLNSTFPFSNCAIRSFSAQSRPRPRLVVRAIEMDANTVTALSVGLVSVAVGIGIPVFYESQINNAVSFISFLSLGLICALIVCGLFVFCLKWGWLGSIFAVKEGQHSALLPLQWLWCPLAIWFWYVSEKCRFCLGSGSVTVDLGGEEKEVSNCINCDGAGSLTCTTCQGSGIQPRYLDRREFKDDD
ncbi:Protein disulfide-isomerase LQY1, chloroplastic [Linum perenne]